MKRSRRYKDIMSKINTVDVKMLDGVFVDIKSSSNAKFDESVELHISYKLNEKELKTPMRGSIVFPNSFGAEKKILVLAEEEMQKKAKDAGADFVGLEDLVKKIEGGFSDFDVVIATPKVMPQIAKLGKQLGPKGLMPNPKTGTVTNDFADVIKTYKAGKVNFKADDFGNIHLTIGKVSMDADKLAENAQVALDAVVKACRSAVSKTPNKIYACSSMGPSFKLKVEF